MRVHYKIFRLIQEILNNTKDLDIMQITITFYNSLQHDLHHF